MAETPGSKPGSDEATGPQGPQDGTESAAQETLAAVEAGVIPPEEKAEIDRVVEATAQVMAHPILQRIEEYDEPSVAARREPAAPTATQAGIRLVLFSDGTGNSSAKAEKTNVWRLFQALDQTTPAQLALYDDGVGTSRVKFLAALGGAFGWGLKRNVIDLYKFVCRNHVDDTTKIYAFGFSRGAFTIRVLTGLITSEGLVNFTSEQELHDRAEAAYDRFRAACFHAPRWSPPWMLRWLRQRAARMLASARRRPAVVDRNAHQAASMRTDIHIEFLGLWDTVAAYGMPIAELKPVVNWLFWPMNFTGVELSKKVKRACHALSLDDERTTFHPILWDQGKHEDQARITQVWFAGVHSNVGGGYPEDQLANVSLEWMMQHARQAGLDLRDDHVERVQREKSAYARIYDSRAGLAFLYRYAPRTIRIPGSRPGSPVLPVIHDSVIARMAGGSDGYVPNALPPDFLVLAPNGELLSMTGYADPEVEHRARTTAPKRPQILATGAADERTQALLKAMDCLSTPEQATIDPILNTIWWRRIAYFLTAAFAAVVAMYPLIAKGLHGAVKYGAAGMRDSAGDTFGGAGLVLSTILTWDKEIRGMVAGMFRAVEAVIPGWLQPWTGAVQQYPVEFALLALAFGASYHLGSWLRGQLRDFKMLAWHAQLRQPYRTALLQTEAKHIKRTQKLLAVFDTIFLLLLLAPGIQAGTPGTWTLAVLVNLLAVARLGWHRRFARVLADPGWPISEGHFNQLIARKMRTSPLVQTLSVNLRKRVVPILFGLGIVCAGFLTLNRTAFDLESASGAFCETSRNGEQHLPSVTGRVLAASSFSTGELCWPSGWRLAARTRYRVTLTQQEAWVDKNTPSGMRGFEANSFVHMTATPLKRWWNERWFAPIAHVGIKGNEEFVLRPCSGGAADQPNVLVAEFTTMHDGELFLFVNDAVSPVPSILRFFYDNNQGTATVQIEPVRSDAGNAAYSCPG